MIKGWKEIPLGISISIRTLHENFDTKVCNIKKPTAYHAKKHASNNVVDHHQYRNRCPRKVGTHDDLLHLKIKIANLRKIHNSNFTAV